MIRLLATVALSYSTLLVSALYTMPPTVTRVDACAGYAWLHINCTRPFMAEVEQRTYLGDISEAEAYALAATAHCTVPNKQTVLFRLKRALAGETFDYCILFKENVEPLPPPPEQTGGTE